MTSAYEWPETYCRACRSLHEDHQRIMVPTTFLDPDRGYEPVKLCPAFVEPVETLIAAWRDGDVSSGAAQERYDEMNVTTYEEDE